MNPRDESRWFAENLQPHEQAVRAYLTFRYPWLRDQDDVLQESYVRVLRARKAGLIKDTRAFLFTTARNAAIDLFRRRSRYEHVELTDVTQLPVLDDTPQVGEALDHHQRQEMLAEALETLPDRCREVVRLRFQENLSYKQIAERLGITTDTVKVQLGRGVRRCAAFFSARNLSDCSGNAKGEPR
jgi:RNA polymerase sigma-70 factor (ECF subfamily)